MSSDERRSHVLTLLDTIDAVGGAEKLALDLLERLDPERYRRTLFVTRWTQASESANPGRSTIARMEAAGVDTLGIERGSRFDVRPWGKLIAYLRREQVDLIHAHKFGSNAWAVLMGHLARTTAVVAHEHMWSYDASGRLHRFVDRRWTGPGSDALIAVSAEGRRQMIEVEGVRPSDIELIPNGVPRHSPSLDRAGARKRLGLPLDAHVVGTVANLRPEKALEVLVASAPLLAKRHPRSCVVIIGDGPERPRLESEIARLGAENVVLAGHRNDVGDVLPGIDVAVCCSDFEGGPLSVMEYMEAGLPVVATEVGGIPELVIDGKTGSLIPPRDSGALATAVGDLLDDEGSRERLGAAGQAAKRSAHDAETWVARLDDLYTRVLAGRVAP